MYLMLEPVLGDNQGSLKNYTNKIGTKSSNSQGSMEVMLAVLNLLLTINHYQMEIRTQSFSSNVSRPKLNHVAMKIETIRYGKVFRNRRLSRQEVKQGK